VTLEAIELIEQRPSLPRAPKHDGFSEFVRSRPAIMLFAVLADASAAAASALISVWWVAKTEPQTPPVWMVLLFVPILVGLLAARGMYRRKLNHGFLDEIGTVETSVALSAMLFLSVMVATRTLGFLGATVFTLWLCAAVLLPLSRLIRATIERLLRRHNHLTSPIVVVGNGRIASRIVDRLKATPDYGLLPVGIIDAEEPWSGPDENSKIDLPYLGIPEEFEKAVVDTGAEGVIIAFSRSRDELLTQVVRISHRHGLRVWVVPRMFDVVGERAWIEHIGGLPLLAFPHTNPQGWQFALKHISDRLAAAIGLVLISPLFLTLTLLVKLSSPGPIFFRQPRVGRDGKVFDCLKFRSMRPPRAEDAEFELKAGAAPGGVEGVDRRTKIGKIMRMTSMDELPQLLNVLKGEMSMVGPRPERPDYVELFEMQIRRYGERHRVKAGITGWAQVHGLRGQTSIADRAEWDNYYIENWSMGLDLKILVLTVLAVLKRAE
jgi:exopolysaccharide biosynthesis polyprenyl glycosylphosphotransferase